MEFPFAEIIPPNTLPKRVFLTGATGLLGRQIAKQLIENQYEVFALIRPESSARIQKVPFKNQIKWIEGDLGDLFALEEGMQKAEIVIHSAALVSFDPRDRYRLHKINAEGTANVVNVALKMPQVKKLIHISSVATLSPSKPQPSDIDERQGFNPDKTTSDYARSKYLAELEVMRAVEEGLKAVMVNPSIILSGGEADESSASLLDYVRKKRPFYSTGWINYVDARDVADVVLKLITVGPEDGKRILLSAGHLEYKEFLNLVSEALGHKGPRWEAGPALSQLAWRLDAIRSFLTGSKRFITRFTAASAAKKFHYSGEGVKKILPEFSYTRINDSIKWMISTIK